MSEQAEITGGRHPRQAAVGRVRTKLGAGRAQLSLVEHALCPLDPAASLRPHLVHETSYYYADRHGHLRTADVRVVCPSGLSAADELVLWGLLALTFSQPDPGPEFHASPHYCLRQLGVITDNDRKGGRQYALFRESIRRIAQVTYMNSRFYDPIRSEHRDVAFGFLKYSLPIDPESSRAWRFIWDTQFFEICQATGGSLFFDLELYRELDFATRRLFVLLQKIFHRSELSPTFDVERLCVDTLGFSQNVAVRDLKIKLAKCIERLASKGVLRLPVGVSSARAMYAKQAVGRYTVVFHRGEYFEQSQRVQFKLTEEDQPFVEQLRQIGFDQSATIRILRTYKGSQIRDWVDVTLAAREKFGDRFFKKSAAAFFLDNIKHAAAGTRTPPDWWRMMRAEERKREQEEERHAMHAAIGDNQLLNAEGRAFQSYLETEAREAFNKVVADLSRDLATQAQSAAETTEKANYLATVHFLNRFRKEHPEFTRDGFERVTAADLHARFGL